MEHEELVALSATVPNVIERDYWMVRGITASVSFTVSSGWTHAGVELLCQDANGLLTKIGIVLDPTQLGALVEVAQTALVRSIRQLETGEPF